MPREPGHLQEGASVQVTPAQPPVPDPNAQPTAAPEPCEPTPAPEEAPPVKPDTPPVDRVRKRVRRLTGGLLGVLLSLTIACVPGLPGQPEQRQAPTQEQAGMDDSAGVAVTDRPSWIPASIPFFHTTDSSHAAPVWRAHAVVAKCQGEVQTCTPEMAYEVAESDNNLLMTAGATHLWNCASGGTCTTTLSTTNAQLAVGDGSTAPAAGDTDLSAAAGTTRAVSAATNASPIVLTVAAGTTWTVGQTVVVAGVGGNTAANGTWEISATNGSTSITLLNSTGNGAYTSGGTAAAINKYRQQANATGSGVVSTNQIVYVATFGTTNANFAWNEWGTTTGAAATNKQATPPPLLFNRATPGGGLGTKTSAASWTLTVTLSLS